METMDTLGLIDEQLEMQHKTGRTSARIAYQLIDFVATLQSQVSELQSRVSKLEEARDE